MRGANTMPVKLTVDEPTKMVSFRMPQSLIEDLATIAKDKKTEKTRLLLAFLREGIERYRREGMVVEVRKRA